jgi:hypothetical protein
MKFWTEFAKALLVVCLLTWGASMLFVKKEPEVLTTEQVDLLAKKADAEQRLLENREKCVKNTTATLVDANKQALKVKWTPAEMQDTVREICMR